MTQPGELDVVSLLKQLGIHDKKNGDGVTYSEAFEDEGIDDISTILEYNPDELFKDIKFKKGHWKKFSRWMTDAKKKSSSNVTSGNNDKEERKEDRETFPDGVNVIKAIQCEYRLPDFDDKDFACNGGKGWTGAVIDVFTTIRDGILNLQKNNKQNNKLSKSRKPKKLSVSNNHKIILICGKTGAGKSTLINSMMNYVYGVKHNDRFRLKLIHEKKKQGGQSKSQTDQISSYFIKKPKGGNINYDLTIVDTPGFGDSRGLKKDMQIYESFKYVFNNVLESVSAVCFVVKSADNRLDHNQTYVFNNILNLWAKNVQENIFILMTFADGKRSNCIDALNAHAVLKHCKNRFKINNSAFTDDPTKNNNDNEGCGDFDKLFWDMGMLCFKKFFNGLENVTPKLIENSKKVIRRRDEIQTKIHHISVHLDSALRKQQSINDEKRKIKKFEKEINDGKEVVIYVNDEKWERRSVSNNWVTTCPKHKTCHPNCGVESKYSCCMMNSDNYCTRCSCHASDHFNANYIYELKQYQIRKSNWDNNSNLKQMHQQGVKNKNRAANMITKLNNELNDLEKDVETKIGLIQRLRNELEEIALRPKLSTVGDYIDELIEVEKDSPNRDLEKIQMLKDLKKKEDLIQKIAKNKKIKLSSKHLMG